MNKTDIALLTALQADGRASYASLARRLKVGESTVRRRMTRLLRRLAAKLRRFLNSAVFLARA